ncbi:hypothetical protein [Longirhabdus pacifica]|uniref:hypothetical protein n=1 Tax=Longirhabdus pacifica TaxID=2305227 RepID=UPI0010093A3C|nr:hypothetical protein [Longirhabdus pacifica]
MQAHFMYFFIGLIFIFASFITFFLMWSDLSMLFLCLIAVSMVLGLSLLITSLYRIENQLNKQK